jgi:hypothetical protein
MSKESLEAKWAEILTDYIVPVKTTNPTLPILFLEFGYTDSVQSPRTPTSQEFETRVFTDENGNGKDDGQETQANIYEAFFSAISSQPGLINGAFLWGHSVMSDAT